MTPAKERAVSSALLEHWDVLAVADTDVEPASEYANEASEVVKLLHAGRSAAEIATFLATAATGLGALPDKPRDDRAARAVCDAYEAAD
jgi:hypothetical protein